LIWEKAGQKDLPPLIRLLCLKEWENMHFSSKIYNHGKPRLPGRKGSVYLLRGYRGEIKAAVMFWEKCQIFPSFPSGEISAPALEELAAISRKEVPHLFSLIGSGDAVQQILGFLEKEPPDVIDYRSMILKPPYGEVEHSKQELQQAHPSDLSRLLQMDLAYQREEVLRNPDYLNVPYARKLFLRQIKNQTVVFGTLEGRPISKAATNARGFHFDQLGGVFTWPNERGKGYARETVEYLLTYLEEEQKQCCLFAKTGNPAAIRLYKKIGFVDKGPFKIAYFF